MTPRAGIWLRTYLCLCLAASAGNLSAQIFADVILVHGKIWTENPQQPEAEAVAILGNRIVAVGTSVEILKLAGPATQVIELGGKRVLPGFNDAHVHFVDGGNVVWQACNWATRERSGVSSAHRRLSP